MSKCTEDLNSYTVTDTTPSIRSYFGLRSTAWNHLRSFHEGLCLNQDRNRSFPAVCTFFSHDTPINDLQLWFRSWWLDTAQLRTTPGGKSWVLQELFLLICILARSCWTLPEQSASPQDQWQCWIQGLITCYILIRQVFRRQSSLKLLSTTTQHAWEKCYSKIAYSQYALTVILRIVIWVTMVGFLAETIMVISWLF